MLISREGIIATWMPKIEGRAKTTSIVRALTDDIRDGRLHPGDRLPAMRDLAYDLGVAVSTIGKAYAEGTRKGLLSSEVGRGTFVVPASDVPFAGPPELSNAVDLAFNTPVIGSPHLKLFADTLRDIGTNGDVGPLLGYHRPWTGRDRFRDAGATWLAAQGLRVSGDDIVLVSGAQHASAVALNCLTEPGDTIITEALMDPGRKSLMASRQLVVKGLPIDKHGLIPEHVEDACRQSARVKVLYCMPNHHSPSLATMPEDRRKAIADIAIRHDVSIVENDVYGPLTESPPPISSFAPRQSYYISSLSKTVAPALRVGYLAVPPGKAADMIPGLIATAWMVPSICAEIATQWIENGTAQKLIEFQRRELTIRNKIAATAFDGFEFQALPTGMHIWMQMPDAWHPAAIVTQARQHDILIAPSEMFAVGRHHPSNAVRLSLGGAVASHTLLKRGLETLASILRDSPENSYLIM